MYPVSEAYKKAIEGNTRKYYWTGTITAKNGKTYEFSNENIVKGSGYITRQCCGSSEIELGTVYSAELGISLFYDIDRYTLDNAEIRMWFHLILPDGSAESIPMGIFYVAEANRKVKTIELKAYDAMLNLEKKFNKGLSSAMPYEFLTLLSKSCHVELAQTKEEIETLTNGTELFGIYQENDIESWRDFLYYLAQSLGCFATIDRYGKLFLVSYGAAEIRSIDSRQRFSSSFSDFVTRYTAVSSTNKKTETAEYYAKKMDDGLTMNLGVNPLLQFGLKETRKRVINAILDAIAVVEYVPFDSDTIGDPALDLGDVLKFTGGHADETKRAAITFINTKINGKQTVKCVGKNPKLAEAKSKNDKNISGLISSISENKLSVYTFANALALEIGGEKVSIINMEFASGDETNAEFHAEAIIKIDSDPYIRKLIAEADIDFGTTNGDTEQSKKVFTIPISWDEDGKTGLTVFYVLDGHEVEEFHPKETWFSGNHLLNLYYPLIELEANQLHTFEVLVSLTNGSGSIEAQNIMATITGQGLGVQERWDGRITAEETMNRIVLSGMHPHAFEEQLKTKTDIPKCTGISDSFAFIMMTGMPLRTVRENLKLFYPIVHDVIEITDKKKMIYNTKYVSDEETFSLRKEYELSGKTDMRINRGRMLKLVIPTAEFSSLTALTILPFDTLPFVNMKDLYASEIPMTDYTELMDGMAVMKKSYELRIMGEDRNVNRGRLVAFNLELSNMDTAENLEVEND